MTGFIDSAYGNTKAVRNGEETIGQAIFKTVVDTAFGAVFGAMGSGDAADIAKSNQISSAGWKGVKTLLSKSVHPIVKETAKKSVRHAVKYTRKAVVTGAVSGAVSTGISKAASRFAEKVYKHYAAVF